MSDNNYYMVGVSNSDEPQGLNRREVMVDSEFEKGSNINELYARKMMSEGRIKLYDYKKKQEFNCEVTEGMPLNSSEYRYGEEYCLGDKVTAITEDGEKNTLRVSEFIISDSAEGLKMYPSFTVLYSDDLDKEKQYDPTDYAMVQFNANGGTFGVYSKDESVSTSGFTKNAYYYYDTKSGWTRETKKAPVSGRVYYTWNNSALMEFLQENNGAISDGGATYQVVDVTNGWGVGTYYEYNPDGLTITAADTNNPPKADCYYLQQTSVYTWVWYNTYVNDFLNVRVALGNYIPAPSDPNNPSHYFMGFYRDYDGAKYISGEGYRRADIPRSASGELYFAKTDYFTTTDGITYDSVDTENAKPDENTQYYVRTSDEQSYVPLDNQSSLIVYYANWRNYTYNITWDPNSKYGHFNSFTMGLNESGQLVEEYEYGAMPKSPLSKIVKNDDAGDNVSISKDMPWGEELLSVTEDHTYTANWIVADMTGTTTESDEDPITADKDSVDDPERREITIFKIRLSEPYAAQSHEKQVDIYLKFPLPYHSSYTKDLSPFAISGGLFAEANTYYLEETYIYTDENGDRATYQIRLDVFILETIGWDDEAAAKIQCSKHVEYWENGGWIEAIQLPTYGEMFTKQQCKDMIYNYMRNSSDSHAARFRSSRDEASTQTLNEVIPLWNDVKSNMAWAEFCTEFKEKLEMESFTPAVAYRLGYLSNWVAKQFEKMFVMTIHYPGEGKDSKYRRLGVSILRLSDLACVQKTYITFEYYLSGGWGRASSTMPAAAFLGISTKPYYDETVDRYAFYITLFDINGNPIQNLEDYTSTNTSEWDDGESKNAVNLARLQTSQSSSSQTGIHLWNNIGWVYFPKIYSFYTNNDDEYTEGELTTDYSTGNPQFIAGVTYYKKILDTDLYIQSDDIEPQKNTKYYIKTLASYSNDIYERLDPHNSLSSNIIDRNFKPYKATVYNPNKWRIKNYVYYSSQQMGLSWQNIYWALDKNIYGSYPWIGFYISSEIEDALKNYGYFYNPDSSTRIGPGTKTVDSDGNFYNRLWLTPLGPLGILYIQCAEKIKISARNKIHGNHNEYDHRFVVKKLHCDIYANVTVYNDETWYRTYEATLPYTYDANGNKIYYFEAGVPYYTLNMTTQKFEKRTTNEPVDGVTYYVQRPDTDPYFSSPEKAYFSDGLSIILYVVPDDGYHMKGLKVNVGDSCIYADGLYSGDGYSSESEFISKDGRYKPTIYKLSFSDLTASVGIRATAGTYDYTIQVVGDHIASTDDGGADKGQTVSFVIYPTEGYYSVKLKSIYTNGQNILELDPIETDDTSSSTSSSSSTTTDTTSAAYVMENNNWSEYAIANYDEDTIAGWFSEDYGLSTDTIKKIISMIPTNSDPSSIASQLNLDTQDVSNIVSAYTGDDYFKNKLYYTAKEAAGLTGKDDIDMEMVTENDDKYPEDATGTDGQVLYYNERCKVTRVVMSDKTKGMRITIYNVSDNITVSADGSDAVFQVNYIAAENVTITTDGETKSAGDVDYIDYSTEFRCTITAADGYTLYTESNKKSFSVKMNGTDITFDSDMCIFSNSNALCSIIIQKVIGPIEISAKGVKL